MALSDELAYMGAHTLATRIRQRELSPVEVLDAFMARIEARNPSLTAFVYQGFDEARAAARQAEAAVMRGDELGPLHGVPTAIKDLFNFKPGWPATFGGVRALKDFKVDVASFFAERVERAGAIVVGMTNSPVMGFRGTCDNHLFGPTRNPFDLARNAGGSSGGAAAAVADGLLPFAQGTDGGGSIRIPAASCGVYGFKASFGRVPFVVRPNAFAHDTPFLFDGPIAREVEDAALVLTAINGFDARDPFSAEGWQDFMPAVRRGVRGMRIAWSPDLDVFPVDPQVAEVVADAVKTFTDAGAEVEAVRIGIDRPQAELSDLWCRLIAPSNLRTLASLKARGFDLLKDHADDLPAEYRHWLEVGRGMTAEAFLQDQETRSGVFDALRSVLERYDLLITPTLACLPPANTADGNTKGPTEINGEAVDPLIGWCMTYPLNFTGHPAASVPAGLAQGLPVGMQIVGRRWADADVLAASAAFERRRPWRDTYRLCADRPLAG